MLIITGGYIYFTYFGDKPDTLIDDVVLTEDKNGGNIQIEFATPVRYLGHYPDAEGEFLQIKLRAISFHEFDENYSIVNKFLKFNKAKDYNLADVRYEGNVPGGPFLIVKFSEPVNFKVNEGDGLKALLINYKTI